MSEPSDSCAPHGMLAPIAAEIDAGMPGRTSWPLPLTDRLSAWLVTPKRRSGTAASARGHPTRPAARRGRGASLFSGPVKEARARARSGRAWQTRANLGWQEEGGWG
jgi:hypothetical protein